MAIRLGANVVEGKARPKGGRRRGKERKEGRNNSKVASMYAVTRVVGVRASVGVRTKGVFGDGAWFAENSKGASKGGQAARSKQGTWVGG